MKHHDTMGDRFKALIAYDPLAGLRHKHHRAYGGKVAAEKVLPPNHQLGMRVPKGGSMCAKCKFLASPTTCGNMGFVEWNGRPKLPAPADEYCCDLYEIGKRRADGGSVRKPGTTYNTKLSPLDEMSYRQWVKDNNVPTDPDAKGPQDYDMRGFYQGLQQQNPRAQSAVDPNDSQMHYPDYWKTPIHQTFSNESQWAPPNAPQWTDDDKLVQPNGRVVFDDRNKPSEADQLLTIPTQSNGGRVHMDTGGVPPDGPTWDNSTPAADGPTWDNSQLADNTAASLPPEAADHGFSERQKLSPLGKAVSPLTSYWPTYQRMMHESLDEASKGVQQILHPESMLDEAKGIGNAAMGTAGYVASPISAGYRSIVGQPIEDVTGIPREYPEFAAQLATPGLGLARIGESAPIVAPPPVTPVESASARLGVPISRAAASDSPTIQSASGALKEVPFVGTPLVKSAKETLGGLDQAAKDTSAAYGSGDAVTAGDAAKSGLEDWITGKSGDIAKRVYGRVDSMVDPDFQRPLHETAETVSNIMAKRANAKISGVSPAVAEVQDAIAAPGMNYQGLKDLRTHIGSMTPQEMVTKGINPGEAKQIYGALTQDLRGHILESGGPDALTTFDKANGVYSQIMDRRKTLSKIIGIKADAAPERVMDRMMQLASSKGGADQGALIQARRAIGPDKWNEVTSAAIDRMGRAAPGADFSGDRFVTAWNNLSDRGRRTLFNSTGKPELAQNVENIMTLSKNYKQLAAMGNPSGTGRVNAIMSALGALGGAVAGTATIGLAAPIAMLGSTLGGRTVAKILSNPVAAKSGAQWAKAYSDAVKSGGSAASVAALAPASQRLSDAVARLAPTGGVPSYAADKQQQAPRVINQ